MPRPALPLLVSSFPCWAIPSLIIDSQRYAFAMRYPAVPCCALAMQISDFLCSALAMQLAAILCLCHSLHRSAPLCRYNAWPSLAMRGCAFGWLRLALLRLCVSFPGHAMPLPRDSRPIQAKPSQNILTLCLRHAAPIVARLCPRCVKHCPAFPRRCLAKLRGSLLC